MSINQKTDIEYTEILLKLLESIYNTNYKNIKKHDAFVKEFSYPQYHCIYDLITETVIFNDKLDKIIPIIKQIYSGSYISPKEFVELDIFNTWIGDKNSCLTMLLNKVYIYQFSKQIISTPNIYEQINIELANIKNYKKN